VRGIHIGVWLGVSDLPSAMTFASLFGLQAFCRTLLLTVIPVEALARIGDAQGVGELADAPRTEANGGRVAPVGGGQGGRGHGVLDGWRLAHTVCPVGGRDARCRPAFTEPSWRPYR
jgi:hypothetical protein